MGHVTTTAMIVLTGALTCAVGAGVLAGMSSASFYQDALGAVSVGLVSLLLGGAALLGSAPHPQA